MTHLSPHIEHPARRLAVLVVPLLVATTGTAAAHSGGSYAGGLMSGSWGGMDGLGLFSGGMFRWPLFVVGLVLLLVYRPNREERPARTVTALAELGEHYGRGELTEEEFEARRSSITQ